MRSNINDALTFMVSWRAAQYAGDRKSSAELIEVVERLCGDLPGPTVKVDIPAGVLSTALSYVRQVLDRTPADDGYCQWPVSHPGEWGDGTCGRGGWGHYLPVCHQHRRALLNAALDLIETGADGFPPYDLTRLLESVLRVQPHGLDQVLINRINALAHNTYQMNPALCTGAEFNAAVDRLLINRLEEAATGAFLPPGIREALDRLIEVRLQQNWGVPA